MKTPPRTVAAALLALGLPALGFVAGYGYGIGKYTEAKSSIAKPLPKALAPVVKGMRVSPNGRFVAFTGVYDQSRRSSRFVFDLRSGKWSAQEAPLGWQDYFSQWSADSSEVLFEREKIPRPVAEAKGGVYGEKVLSGATSKASNSSVGADGPAFSQPRALTQGVAPGGEKIVTGFWDDRGHLIIKTRSEPKALYRVDNGRAVLVDRSPGTYQQNRAVTENGRTVYYVVRDAGPEGAVALFRIDGKQVRQLSERLEDVAYSYVTENGRHMIAARYADNEEDWRWTLYAITPARALKKAEATIPGDVISVYWSPDFRHVLGSSGQSLWLIDVPSLRVRRLGQRRNWNADDAAWTSDGKNVLVAADGRLYEIGIANGRERERWRFPASYWK